MKKTIIVLLFMFAGLASAQSPGGKEFGFGIVIGEPTGLTIKYWTQRTNAFVFNIGASYFGSPRLGADYLWHFDAFNSNIAKLYAGPGVALGFGQGKGFWYKDKYYRDSGELGVAARGVFGVNVVPQSSPLEFFFEIGVLVGFAPSFGSNADVALGMRFYP